MATAMMHCAACNSSHPNYICGGCRRVAYCDVACQSKDWKSVHRWNCPAGAVGDDIDSDLDAESGGAINDFGLSVLATMDKNVREKGSPQCVLISPLSISIALAMLAEGAIGKTRDEIVRWIDPDGEISKIGLDTLMPKGAGSISNSIWLKHTGTPQYEEILRKKYGAEMFYRISANDINAWAEKNTDGMIKEIVRDLPRTTIAVLVNALWFSCLWLDPFDKNLTAEDGEFFGPTGKRKCAMMFRRAEEDMDCAALGDGSAVAAFLPLSDEYMSKDDKKPKGMATTRGPRKASRLELIVAVDPRSRDAPPPTTKGVAELLRSRQSKKVALRLPRTSLELPATSILGELNALGINRCCSFHNEFPGFDNPRDARVDDVLHATKLEFDERGAKGAAVTAIVMVEKATRTDEKEDVLFVNCDHPFFVGVLDSRTNVLIMAGYVYHPMPK